MQTLKRAVIILALSIPLHRELVEPTTAEAYTYQDVENAYNAAKSQYPNDYIFIEEFNQDGQKGYKIWKRPTGIVYSVSEYWLSGFPVSNTVGGVAFCM